MHRVRIDVGSGIKSYDLDDLKFDQLVNLIEVHPRNDGTMARNDFGFVPGTHSTHGVPDDAD